MCKLQFLSRKKIEVNYGLEKVSLGVNMMKYFYNQKSKYIDIYR